MRLKGDKPDINLADSQTSTIEQAASESANAAPASMDGDARESNGARSLNVSQTASEANEEMELAAQMAAVFEGAV